MLRCAQNSWPFAGAHARVRADIRVNLYPSDHLVIQAFLPSFHPWICNPVVGCLPFSLRLSQNKQFVHNENVGSFENKGVGILWHSSAMLIMCSWGAEPASELRGHFAGGTRYKHIRSNAAIHLEHWWVACNKTKVSTVSRPAGTCEFRWLQWRALSRDPHLFCTGIVLLWWVLIRFPSANQWGFQVSFLVSLVRLGSGQATMLIGLAWVSSWTRCGLKHRSDRQWIVSGTDHQELIRCEEGLISGAMFRFGTLNIRNAHEFLCRHHLVIGLRTFSSTWKPSGSFSRLDYRKRTGKEIKNKVALLFSAEILDHFWIIWDMGH